MLMTELDAMTKWCPMARVKSIDGAWNRPAVNPTAPSCLGSECMLWQWEPVIKMPGFWEASNPLAMSEDEAGGRPDKVPASWVFEAAIDGPAGWVEPQSDYDKRRRGFCGLARQA